MNVKGKNYCVCWSTAVRARYMSSLCFTTSCQSFSAQLRSSLPAAGRMLRAITVTGGVGCARAGTGGRGTVLLDAARRAGRAGGLSGAVMVDAGFTSPASSFVSVERPSFSTRVSCAFNSNSPLTYPTSPGTLAPWTLLRPWRTVSKVCGARPVRCSAGL